MLLYDADVYTKCVFCPPIFRSSSLAHFDRFMRRAADINVFYSLETRSHIVRGVLFQIYKNCIRNGVFARFTSLFIQFTLFKTECLFNNVALCCGIFFLLVSSQRHRRILCFWCMIGRITHTDTEKQTAIIVFLLLTFADRSSIQ